MSDYIKELTLKGKLGLIIKTKRKEMKMTQENLSQKINCDQSVISRIEVGNESIDMEIYQLALKALKLKHNEDDTYQSIVFDVFTKTLHTFAFVLYEEIKDLEKLIDDIEKKNQSIIIKYEIYVLKCFYNYFKRNHKISIYYQQLLKDVIHVCRHDFQLLYFVMKLNTELIYFEYDKTNDTIEIIHDYRRFFGQKYYDMIAYFLGWYYFKKSNRSMALKYLLDALETFKEQNNYVRIYRVEIIINSFLIKEKNYDLAINHYLRILDDLMPYIRLYDIYLVYFWIGYCFYMKHELDFAIIYFNKALEVEDLRADKNHVCYYLLLIYDELEDIKQFRQTLNKTNYDDEESFGNKIINLYLQSRISKTNRYYEYIEKNILPFMTKHYEKNEIASIIVDLLNYYYETQQYTKYRDLSKQIFYFLA